MEYIRDNIGERLKLARQFLKIKQTEMGAALGISQSEMSKIEYNKQKINIDIIYGLKEKYNINIYHLGNPSLTMEEICRDSHDIVDESSDSTEVYKLKMRLNNAENYTIKLLKKISELEDGKNQ